MAGAEHEVVSMLDNENVYTDDQGIGNGRENEIKPVVSSHSEILGFFSCKYVMIYVIFFSLFAMGWYVRLHFDF